MLCSAYCATEAVRFCLLRCRGSNVLPTRRPRLFHVCSAYCATEAVLFLSYMYRRHGGFINASSTDTSFNRSHHMYVNKHGLHKAACIDIIFNC